MRIIKVEEELKGSQIILIREDHVLDNFITDSREKTYVKKRLAGEKKLAILNRLDHLICFRMLEREDTAPGTRFEQARKAGFEIHPILNDQELQSVTIVNAGVDQEECMALAEGLALSSYQFLKYQRPETSSKYSLKEISLFDKNLDNEHLEKLENLVNAVYLSRDLVNEPLSYLTAVQLSAEIHKMGSSAGFSVEVFNKKQIESLKMGGLLAVNKGSVDPPTFSIMEYKPENPINNKPYVFVGKGVVYDTGGMNIKTGNFMNDMKCDMAGGATIASAVYAIARAKLPVHVIGLVPATDNRTNGNAYVSGDIITMFDGTKVEVINTDAEGRMLLADALSYAKKYDPKLVIDVATLTGSAMRAIGKYGIVSMQSKAESEFKQLTKSGESVNERVVEFPFWKEYREELKSDIADIKHLSGADAGCITAGKFLEHFTDYPYIHLDIAGPAFFDKPFKYYPTGGTGFGVRLLFDFIKNKK